MKFVRTFGLLVISAGIMLGQDTPSSLSSIFTPDSVVQPLGASSATAAFQYVVAHFPFGGGWNTNVTLANSGKQAANVTITFLSEAGASMGVPVEGSGMQSSEKFTVQPNDVHVVGGDPSKRNASGLNVAWAMVSSSAPLNVFSLFDFGPNPPAISGAVGAQSTPAAKSFRFPVAINGPFGYNAGMALANPNSSNTAVTVKVLNADGSVKGSFQETLQPNNQNIFTLTSKLPNTFGPAQFNGSVAVCASQPIGLVTVGFEGGQAFFTTSVTNDPCP